MVIHTYIHTYLQIYIAPKIVRTNLNLPAGHRITRRNHHKSNQGRITPRSPHGQPICCNGSRSLSLSRAWYVTTEHSGQSGRSAGRTLPDAALGDANGSGNDRVRPHRSPHYGRFQSAEPAIRRLDGQLMRRSFDSITRVWTVRSRTWIN